MAAKWKGIREERMQNLQISGKTSANFNGKNRISSFKIL
jgi:hypothetical protein